MSRQSMRPHPPISPAAVGRQTGVVRSGPRASSMPSGGTSSTSPRSASPRFGTTRPAVARDDPPSGIDLAIGRILDALRAGGQGFRRSLRGVAIFVSFALIGYAGAQHHTHMAHRAHERAHLLEAGAATDEQLLHIAGQMALLMEVDARPDPAKVEVLQYLVGEMHALGLGQRIRANHLAWLEPSLETARDDWNVALRELVWTGLRAIDTEVDKTLSETGRPPASPFVGIENFARASRSLWAR